MEGLETLIHEKNNILRKCFSTSEIWQKSVKPVTSNPVPNCLQTKEGSLPEVIRLQFNTAHKPVSNSKQKSSLN